jgi:ADP-ribose pyrophosphatase YjhB (NUDIX family)
VIRRRSPLRNRLVGIGYAVFYRIPHPMRNRLVRLVTANYVLGAVVLIFDSEAGADPIDTIETGGAVPAHGADRPPARLLLLRQPPGRGWTLPAGLLNRGETPLAGAVREAAEETGIRLDPRRVSPAVPNAMVHTRGQWVDLVFTTRVPASTTAVSVDGAEVWEASWHPLDRLPPLTPATARLLGHYGIGPAAPGSAGRRPSGDPAAAVDVPSPTGEMTATTDPGTDPTSPGGIP